MNAAEAMPLARVNGRHHGNQRRHIVPVARQPGEQQVKWSR